ncbi:hypothetical protein GCM10023169_37990 [Georgenia halophila]|uniref:Uncharacterized protein n=1 Tax=Georgenia halophila TaxID=620889 RepID=A0ABP8LM76_9MICO
MQLTISSEDPLEQVLRAVGAMYGVDLVPVEDVDASPGEHSGAPPGKGKDGERTVKIRYD